MSLIKGVCFPLIWLCVCVCVMEDVGSGSEKYLLLLLLLFDSLRMCASESDRTKGHELTLWLHMSPYNVSIPQVRHRQKR